MRTFKIVLALYILGLSYLGAQVFEITGGVFETTGGNFEILDSGVTFTKSTAEATVCEGADNTRVYNANPAGDYAHYCYEENPLDHFRIDQ